jgi:peptidyl-prolyl cis-trans isomerase B (cyclophilin B)
VPSAKRARIRANQQRLKEAEIAKKRRRRRARNGVILVVVLVLVFFGIYLLTKPPAKKAHSATKAHPTSYLLADGCPNPKATIPRITSFAKYPPMCMNPNDTYTAVVKTTAGTFDIRLEPKLGPKSANNFYVLSLYHFYNGTTFFRVIPGFVIQGGSPTNADTGTPGYHFGDKNPPAGSYHYGTVAMANPGTPNSNGSQFFIVSGKAGESELSNTYSIVGQVTSGLSVLAKINDGGSSANNGIPPKTTYRIISVTMHVTPTT